MKESLPATMADLPGALARRFRRSMETTPGRLGLALAGVVVLSLLLAIIGSVMVSDKQGQIDDLIHHREPVAAASQEVYRSLADAEASSGTAALFGGEISLQQRDRYQHDVADAGAAIAGAAESGDDGTGAVAQVSRVLPTYSGLLETAAANHRQGYPVGASYLLSASSLLRSVMLPAALTVHDREIGKLGDELDNVASFPWLTVILFLGLGAAIFAVSRFLRQRTNRLLNKGLVAAAAVLAVLFVWSLIACTFAAVHMSNARGDGSDQVVSLSVVRLYLVEGRADETLGLVAANDDRYDRNFADMRKKLVGDDGKGGAVQAAIDAAEDTPVDSDATAIRDGVNKWLATHDRVSTATKTGDSTNAITLATSQQPTGSGGQFTAVDAKLRDAIENSRQNFVHSASAARNSLTLLQFGVLVLAIIVGALAASGIWQRLKEYR